MESLDLLDRLVAFPTVSQDSNRDLIAFIEAYLGERGIRSELVLGEEGRKANLLALIGPKDVPGILLSAHTDVVPAAGQTWATDPFRLTRRDDRLYARGATDMKGFLAACLRAADLASRSQLTTPLILCFSHDEEVGCVGVRSAIAQLAAERRAIRLALVGEPTSMRLAVAHKGKIAARAVFRGRSGHSSQAPLGLNAIHLACDFVEALKRKQDALAASSRDDDFDIPYTTLHAGVIAGGTALNIVPGLCTIDFEVRGLPDDDADAILAELTEQAVAIAVSHRSRIPEAQASVEVVNSYPALSTAPDSEAVRFVADLTEMPDIMKVAYGTEGGLFSERLGIPAVVCGPGSIEQAHKPDEFITLDQMQACDRMMDRLVARLQA